MKDIFKLKNKMDSLDYQLCELFEKRMEIVMEIAEYKKESHLPICDPSREEVVIRKNLEHIKNKELEKAAETFLRSIMEISKDLQHQYIASQKKVL